MSPLSAVDRRLLAVVPAASVHRLRTALALVVGARLLLTDYRVVADLPTELFSPPWFLAWLGSPPSATVVGALQLVGLAAVVGVAATRGRSAVPFAAAWVALVVLGGLQTSAGKVMHNDVLLVLAAAPFAVPTLVPGGGARLVAGWQHRTAMALVALGYLLAGLAKLRHSGLDWVVSDNLRWVLYSGARSSRSVLPGVARFVADQLWLTIVIAAATLATEILFPLGLVWERARVALAAASVALHLGVFLLLGLDYSTWVAVVLVLFLPWQRWLGRRLDATRAYASHR